MIGFHIAITVIISFDSPNPRRIGHCPNEQGSSSEMAMYAVCMAVDAVWWTLTGEDERCDLPVLIIPGQSICHTLATPGLYAGAPLLHGLADPIVVSVVALHHIPW